MNKAVSTLLFSLVALHYGVADTTVETTEPAAPVAAETASSETAPPQPTIQLKNKSTFAVPENARNPFWPIGWKPAAKQAIASTTEPAGVEILPSAFVVTSIVLDPRARFAIINGKVMNEGQVFGLQIGNQTYQMTVKAIEDGRVILLRGRDQEIVVPLRRR